MCSNVFIGASLGLSGKESAYYAGDSEDMGSIPRMGRSLGRGNGNPFQYSCLENPMDRGAWWAVVHGVAELDATEHTHTICLSIFLIYGRLSEYSELLQDHYLLIF